MKADLDPFDWAILAVLQKNNLTPQREIAERIMTGALMRRTPSPHESPP